MSGAATLILHHGKVVTMDRGGTIAEAVAMADGTILHVGRSVEIQPFIGPETQLIDLDGKCVIRGIPVTIETDGNPIEPLHALWAVVARRERETGELITFEEAKKGSIEPGKLADLVVLGEDLFEVSEERLKDIPIVSTIVGCQIVNESPVVSATSKPSSVAEGASARV